MKVVKPQPNQNWMDPENGGIRKREIRKRDFIFALFERNCEGYVKASFVPFNFNQKENRMEMKKSTIYMFNTICINLLPISAVA